MSCWRVPCCVCLALMLVGLPAIRSVAQPDQKSTFVEGWENTVPRTTILPSDNRNQFRLFSERPRMIWDIPATTTPKVGSPQWNEEKAQNEAKERRLRQVIEGICRGC
jgi:hypothetical protein